MNRGRPRQQAPEPLDLASIPWSPARAWIKTIGLDKVARALGLAQGTLSNFLGRDELPEDLCKQLSVLSRSKFKARDFRFRVDTQK